MVEPTQFVEFEIDLDISEGNTDLDLRNDTLMRDLNTQEVRLEASRNKLKDKNRMEKRMINHENRQLH